MITRGGYLDKGTSTDKQKYHQYDKFGNRTEVTLKGEITNKSDGSILSSSEEVTLATYDYQENNGPLTGMIYGLAERALSSVAYTYDHLERVDSVKYTDVDPVTNAITETTYGYNYSVDGSLAGIMVNGSPAYEYTYDDQNQLILEKLPSVQTSDYNYDTYGNLCSKKTAYSNNGTYEQYSYTYGNASWKDQLTAISYRDRDGVTHNGTFSYDVAGNPLTYNNGKKNWEFTWQHGRQLATAKSGTVEITNTYDVDGIRDSKTVNGVKHSYTTLGGKIVRETYGSYTVDYFYDQDGRPYKMVVQEVGKSYNYTGYFVTNLQGDVIAIVDANGAVAVEYEYDAWGKEIYYDTHTNQGDTLYQYNALKYRGYYYDSEPANRKSRENYLITEK